MLLMMGKRKRKIRWGPGTDGLLDTLHFLDQLLKLAAFADPLVGLVDDAAQIELGASLAWLAWNRAGVALDFAVAA